MPLGPFGSREAGTAHPVSQGRPADTEPETPGGGCSGEDDDGPSLTDTRRPTLRPRGIFAGPLSFYSKDPASDQPEAFDIDNPHAQKHIYRP